MTCPEGGRRNGSHEKQRLVKCASGLVELKQRIATLQVCPWGTVRTHIQMLSKHTQLQVLAKQLSRCHKHYNQVNTDSLSTTSSSAFFPQPLPPFLSFCHPLSPLSIACLQQTTHHINTVQTQLHTLCLYTFRAGCCDLKSTDKLSGLH